MLARSIAAAARSASRTVARSGTRDPFFAASSGISKFFFPRSASWQLPQLKPCVLIRPYSMKLSSSARAREQMRLNQQREAKPAQPGPTGIPSTEPVRITNVIPTGIPPHPNAPKPASVMVVSAGEDPTTLGDCPFSQRVLMTLEEKHIPYEGRFIDVENKPTWFLQMYPEGKVPCLFIEQTWVGGADLIAERIEKRVSIPTMRAPAEKASIGSKILPLFFMFLKSKDPSDGSEQALIMELQLLNEHLKTEDATYKNPFMNGRFPSMLDMDLAPKLYHLIVALKHFKKWTIPLEFTYLDAYIKKMFARPSFTKTKPPEDLIIRGWERHLG
ncbi:hypothetical protein O6H91_18G024700 [Diphasiastrum complanatum]|uniref:Uncharacterized protein n=1 Tax=Diphasiastrum complanatum TaxID=34168 RepID=A0ACC2AZ60_DIPCM|nr:hypothetical protein O6H91_18G024700 [Diphasiastrum complanatum]